MSDETEQVDDPPVAPDEKAAADTVDWRIRIVTHLAKDLAPAYPGGPSHKAGALVVQETPGKDAKGKPMGFATPSAVGLALSLAIRASEEAERLRIALNRSSSVSPFGESASVTMESTPDLYDFFERCMTSVTFSFQALEGYCNEVISYKAPTAYPLKRKKNVKHVTPEELEREASTDEKLAIILPDLLKIVTPKGGRLWQPYQVLKQYRDSTIHIKSHDFSPRVRKPSDLDDASLFARMLGADVYSWPKASVALITYFDTDEVPRFWIDHVVQRLGIKPTKRKGNQAKQPKSPRGKR